MCPPQDSSASSRLEPTEQEGSTRLPPPSPREWALRRPGPHEASLTPAPHQHSRSPLGLLVPARVADRTDSPGGKDRGLSDKLLPLLWVQQLCPARPPAARALNPNLQQIKTNGGLIFQKVFFSNGKFIGNEWASFPCSSVTSTQLWETAWLKWARGSVDSPPASIGLRSTRDPVRETSTAAVPTTTGLQDNPPAGSQASPPGSRASKQGLPLAWTTPHGEMHSGCSQVPAASGRVLTQVVLHLWSWK